jgi:hypothetical protein
MSFLRSFMAFAVLTVTMVANSRIAEAALVGLQQGTATFSQGSLEVDEAINGILAGTNDGWGIDPFEVNQTAAFESTLDFGFAGGTILTFVLTHGYPVDPHPLGRFRLSVTTDDRSLFADGLDSGGDVTANWVVLNPLSASAIGATLTILGDGSLLASGPSPAIDTYTVTAFTPLVGMTGIRVEALEDPSLPHNGPGRQPNNGNFVLTELTVDAAPVPEPASLCVWTGLALIAAGGAWRRKRN